MMMDGLMFRPGLMDGERILVTGGGTGIGRELATAFLSLGAEVIICGRRGGKLDEAAAEMTAAQGGKVTAIPCDIRSPDAIAAMVDRIWEDGPLTGLVNNAAGNFISRTEDLSTRGFDAISDTVFKGTFYVTLDVGKRLIAEKRKASFLSILTTWVWNGSPFTVPSAMSKAGINVMTQSLAMEWGRYGLRFNAIAPGAFPTKGMSERLSPKGNQEMKAGNPMGRTGEMHEICNLAVFLMGQGAEYVNGQTIAIDGAGYQANGGNFWPSLSPLGDEQWRDMAAKIRASNDRDKGERTT